MPSRRQPIHHHHAGVRAQIVVLRLCEIGLRITHDRIRHHREESSAFNGCRDHLRTRERGSIHLRRCLRRQQRARAFGDFDIHPDRVAADEPTAQRRGIRPTCAAAAPRGEDLHGARRKRARQYRLRTGPERESEVGATGRNCWRGEGEHDLRAILTDTPLARRRCQSDVHNCRTGSD